MRTTSGSRLDLAVSVAVHLATLLTILGSLLPVRALRAAGQDRSLEIEALVQSYADAGQFSGAVLVAEEDEIVYRGAYGLANREWNISNDVDTKFRIGSITKSFTATLVLQLAAEGMLDLDSSIGHHLTEFSGKETGTITIQQLLTHSSGLPDYNDMPVVFRLVQGGLSKEERLRQIADYPLHFQPGSGFGYSNDGYVVLGAILEKVIGEPYEAILGERILVPLEMNDSGYFSPATIIEKRASGYRQTVVGYENAPHYRESPASGMYSTVNDLYRWQRALAGDRVLPRATLQRIWGEALGSNVYGWRASYRTVDGDSLLMIENDGAVFGFFARMIRVPRDGFVVILLANVRRGPVNYLPRIGYAIVDLLHGRHYDRPLRSIAQALYPIVQSSGRREAVARYDLWLRERPDDFDFRESELNELGYQLLSEERIDDAILIFERNVMAYPESWNVYDSLGEAYALKGECEKAIEAYERSLHLNPQNGNAKEQLRSLRSRVCRPAG